MSVVLVGWVANDMGDWVGGVGWLGWANDMGDWVGRVGWVG